MLSANPFEFLDVTLPADGDLRLVLAGAERRKMCFRLGLT
jgi:hypothetical protein